MRLGLEGRVCLVSGGSRGIGLAVVRSLLAEGASVVTFARDGDRLRAAVDELDPDRLLASVVDVRDREAVAGLVSAAVDRFGRLDGVVANAGAGVAGGVLDTAPEVWDAQFEVKVRAALNVVEPAVGRLPRDGSGSIVVVNGVTAHAPDDGLAAVGAARAALANVTALLARRLAGDRIRVNTVDLGAIVTDRQRERHAASGSALGFDAWCDEEAVRRGIPLGRLGRPEEVAPCVTFLLSRVASYVTGATLDVAGGLGARV